MREAGKDAPPYGAFAELPAAGLNESNIRSKENNLMRGSQLPRLLAETRTGERRITARLATELRRTARLMRARGHSMGRSSGCLRMAIREDAESDTGSCAK